MMGGIPAFFHRDFEEVNLRFYVRRREGGEVRRGVVFIKEIVPKPLLAWTAWVFYSENYVCMPMSSEIREGSSYRYRFGMNELSVLTEPKPLPVSADSHERWITEHYWGYTRVGENRAYEYEVKHPVWNLFPVKSFELKADLPSLYGAEFAETLSRKPRSVFVADGSPVSVHWPRTLT